MSPPEWCHVDCQLSPAPSLEQLPSSSSEPPVNDGQQRSTVANHRSTTVSHRRTIVAPPTKHHQSKVVDRWSTIGLGRVNDRIRMGRIWIRVGSGCHVDHSESATWHPYIYLTQGSTGNRTRD
uniref:Uncharacterized protein n=1 Tax=Tanacetum cinerariifolium TaxID=118510 RepID=A0A6L2K238_TANCI|nr:hypothetical protein [Tanacetum cinerariifolium]